MQLFLSVLQVILVTAVPGFMNVELIQIMENQPSKVKWVQVRIRKREVGWVKMKENKSIKSQRNSGGQDKSEQDDTWLVRSILDRSRQGREPESERTEMTTKNGIVMAELLPGECAS